MLASAFAYRVCTSRAGNGTRIWLEGARLVAAGFNHKLPCSRQWADNRLTITAVDQATFDALPRTDRTTIAGTPTRPIIDITGTKVRDTFPSGNVLVTYSHQSITIEGI